MKDRFFSIKTAERLRKLKGHCDAWTEKEIRIRAKEYFLFLDPPSPDKRLSPADFAFSDGVIAEVDRLDDARRVQSRIKLFLWLKKWSDKDDRARVKAGLPERDRRKLFRPTLPTTVNACIWARPGNLGPKHKPLNQHICVKPKNKDLPVLAVVGIKQATRDWVQKEGVEPPKAPILSAKLPLQSKIDCELHRLGLLSITDDLPNLSEKQYEVYKDALELAIVTGTQKKYREVLMSRAMATRCF